MKTTLKFLKLVGFFLLRGTTYDAVRGAPPDSAVTEVDRLPARKLHTKDVVIFSFSVLFTAQQYLKFHI